MNDVQWSPTNSTAFASATKDGRIEVWDMKMSTLKPVVCLDVEDVSLNCLLFNSESPVIAVGTDKGSVKIFRLYNIEDREKRREEQIERLQVVLRDNIMRKGH